jgi:hypothetical protein
MARNAVTDWDPTPSNNSDVGGTNIAEGCPAGGINDAIRTVMAQIAVWVVAATGPLIRVAANTIANGALILDGAATPVARPIGYRSLYRSRSVTAAAIIALTDEGQAIYSTTGGLTVPTNATVACPLDFQVAFYNNSGTAQTITPASGVTLRIEGATSTVASTVSVPAYTRAFLWQTAANSWLLSGRSLT